MLTATGARRLDKFLSSTEGFDRNASLEYRFETDSGTASISVYTVLPNGAFDRVCKDFRTDC